MTPQPDHNKGTFSCYCWFLEESHNLIYMNHSMPLGVMEKTTSITSQLGISQSGAIPPFS